MTNDPWFDQAAGIAARDEGMLKVLENSILWADRALAAVIKLPTGWTGMGEDIRLHVIPLAGAPSHPNAWGALIRTAKAKNLLRDTGVWKMARSVKNHASKYPELVRT